MTYSNTGRTLDQLTARTNAEVTYNDGKKNEQKSNMLRNTGISWYNLFKPLTPDAFIK